MIWSDFCNGMKSLKIDFTPSCLNLFSASTGATLRCTKNGLSLQDRWQSPLTDKALWRPVNVFTFHQSVALKCSAGKTQWWARRKCHLYICKGLISVLTIVTFSDKCFSAENEYIELRTILTSPVSTSRLLIQLEDYLMHHCHCYGNVIWLSSLHFDKLGRPIQCFTVSTLGIVRECLSVPCSVWDCTPTDSPCPTDSLSVYLPVPF